MAITRVDSLFDVESINAEYRKLIDMAKDISDKMLALSNKDFVSVSSAKSITEVEKVTTNLSKSVSQLSKAQEDFVQQEQKLITSITDELSVKEKIKIGNLALFGSIQDNIKAQIHAKAEIDNLKKAYKDLESDLKSGAISQDAFAVSAFNLKEQELRLKEELRKVNLFLNNQVKEAQAGEDSTNKLQQQVMLLKKAYNDLSTAEKSSNDGQALANKIKNMSDLINQEKKKVGDYSSNIGRYEDAIAQYAGNLKEPFSILANSLQNVNNKIDTIGDDTSGLQKLQKEQALLKQLLDSTNKVFGSSKGELKAYSEAVRQLGLQVGTDSQLFKDLSKSVGQATDEIADINNIIKQNASDTQKLEGGIAVVEGLAGGFEAAAGLAALFGEEGKAVQETLLKLNAVQAIANGLRQVSILFLKEEKAAQFLGNVQASIRNALQKAYNSIAGEGATVTTRLGFAMKALALTGVLLLITGLVYAYQSLSSSTAKATADQKTMKEILDKASESYGDIVIGVQKLTTNFELAKQGLYSKNQALKEYNETMGKTVGQAKTYNEAEELLIKNADRYIQVQFLKAEADAAAQLSKEALVNKLKATNKTDDEIMTGTEKAAMFMATALGNEEEQRERFAEGIKMRRGNLISEYDIDARKFLEKQKDLLTRAQKLSNEYGFKPTYDADEEIRKKQEAKDKEAREKAKQQAKEHAKKIAEINQRNKEAQAENDLQNSNEQLRLIAKTVEDEKRSLEERLFYENLYFRKKLENVDLNTKKELSKKDLTSQQIKGIEDKARIEKVKADEEHVAKIDSINKQAHDKEIEERKKRFEFNKNQQEQSIKDLEALKSAGTSSIDTDKSFRLVQAEKDYQSELLLANGNFEKIEEAKKNHELAKANIEAEYAKDRVRLEIEVTKRLIDAMETSGIDVADKKRELAELEMQLSGIVTNKIISDAKAAEDARIKSLDNVSEKISKVSEIEQAVSSIVTSLYDIGYEKNKVKNEEDTQRIEDKKNREIEAINATTLSEEEKAARLKIVESEAERQKSEIARRQKKQDADRARVQKALSIAEITINTIAAVTNALKTGIPPYNLLQAVLVGAVGAAQLAKAVSTPIPQYRDGTDYLTHKGTLIAGEAGIEGIKEPNKPMYLTPNKATYYDKLPIGTKIVPNYRLKDYVLNKQPPMLVVNGNGELVERNNYIEKLAQENQALKNEVIKVGLILKGKSFGTIAINSNNIDVEYYNKYVNNA